MHLLFGSLSLKNSTIKYVWFGAIMRWVFFWKVSQEACEWEQNMLKGLVLVYKTVNDLESSQALQVISEMVVDVSKRLPIEDYDQWRVLTNEKVEWIVIMLSVVECKSLRCQHLKMLHSVY